MNDQPERKNEIISKYYNYNKSKRTRAKKKESFKNGYRYDALRIPSQLVQEASSY